VTDSVVFTVYGKPQPAGSKRVVPAGGKRGGRPLVIDAAKHSRPWKQEVAGVAELTMEGRALLAGALVVELRFYMARPRGHYGAHGLRALAPVAPTVRPDLLKLARAVEDALTGIVYHDDSQIVVETLLKVYDQKERVEVLVRPLEASFDLGGVNGSGT